MNELTAFDEFALTFRAGSAGGGRAVTWAHSCEQPDPWKWVAAGNLLMTWGSGIPIEPREQADWIEKLADANVSGLLVTAPEGGAQLSDQMLAAADRRLLPILTSRFDIEFATLAKLIVDEDSNSQRARFEASLEFFRAFNASLRNEENLEKRLETVARKEKWRLEVTDVTTGVKIVVPPGVEADDGNAIGFDIPGRWNAVLKVTTLRDNNYLNLLQIQLLASLVGTELEHQARTRDDRRVEGEALFRELIDGDVDLTAAKAILDRRGLAGDLVVAALQPAGPSIWTPDDVHHAPDLRSVTPLLLRTDVILAIVVDDDEVISSLRRHLGANTKVGISRPCVGNNLLESIRQARLALHHLIGRHLDTARYGSLERLSILSPRTLEEARELVQRHLGGIISYDREHNAALLRTLETFLTNDSSWKRTAAELLIHRQTLVHRLRTVEQITGQKPTSTAATAAFWLALEIGRTTRILPGMVLEDSRGISSDSGSREDEDQTLRTPNRKPSRLSSSARALL